MLNMKAIKDLLIAIDNAKKVCAEAEAEIKQLKKENDADIERIESWRKNG